MTATSLAQPVAAGHGAAADLQRLRVHVGWALWLASLAAIVLVVYSATLARDLTWQNGGGDGAELATAAYVGGVAHPPGYPLYLSALRLAQLVPIGSPAVRSNAFSALSAAVAALLLCATLGLLLSTRSGRINPSAFIGASFGAAVFSFAPLVWSQAVVTEVYTFEALLFSLFLLSVVTFWRQPGNARLLLAGGALGMLVSHHPPFTVAIVPLTWMAGAWNRSWQTYLMAIVTPLLIAVGLLATVALRASSQPWLSWGEATTFGAWFAQVSAASYHDYFLSASLAEDAVRTTYAAATLVRQGGWLAIVCSALGLNWLWQQWGPAAVLSCGIAAFFGSFAVLYNARDSIVYLMPSVVVLALGAGLGAAWLLRLLAPKVAIVLVCSLLASIGWQVLSGWSEVDASQDHSARSWATQRLRDAPRRAVVHVQADEQLFALWYLQGVEDVRPDVVVVDDWLLATPWFCSQLQRQHPEVQDCRPGRGTGPDS